MAAAAVVLPGVADRAWDEFRGAAETSATQPSNDPAARLHSLSGNRYNLWRSALDAFEAEPWNGTGPGTFEFWWNRDAVNAEHVRDAHSLVLESMAEAGLVGLLGVLVLVVGLLWLGVLSRGRASTGSERAAAVAAISGAAVWVLHANVDWMWESTAVTVGALLLVASAGAPTRLSHLPLHGSARAGTAVLALLAIAVQLPPLASTSAVRASQRAAARSDVPAATNAAADAVAASPWSASPYVQRALLAEARGDLDDAAADVMRAIRRESTNWRHHLLLARIEAERGHPREALTAAERARRLRPLSSFFPRAG
jgi:hypothetical protein